MKILFWILIMVVCLVGISFLHNKELDDIAKRTADELERRQKENDNE